MTNISFNNLTKADGSALIDQDGTIVQATVFGPVDISQSKINYEEAVVEILFKPKVNIAPSSPAFDYIREIENLIRKIYNGGSLLSATINAVCCALIDAGLPMKCPVSGVSIKLNDEDQCKFDFVFDNKLNLITILTRGCINEDDLQKAVELGKQAATRHFEEIRKKVRERFTC